MASASLLALIDDITSMLDDVSAMTQIAAKKTAGVLGDDLALNAQQVAGVDASRELPVVWAVAKGSFINKLMLVPSALLISYIAPWLITPLLMLGGAYLCFEGFEKVWHKLFHADKEQAHENQLKQALENTQTDLVALDKEKIQGAIRTDFILSAEIIVIALGSAAGTNASFAQQAMVVTTIAIIMTIGVYGLVAGIVKMDDIGLWMMQKPAAILRKIGWKIVQMMPYLMRGLAILGTAAMFLVGGGIVAHGLPLLHDIHSSVLLNGLLSLLVGMLTGALCLVLVNVVNKILK